jgi:hypothetical protein
MLFLLFRVGIWPKAYVSVKCMDCYFIICCISKDFNPGNTFGRAGNCPSSLRLCLLYQTFSWYKFPDLVQSFGTNFVLSTRLHGTKFLYHKNYGTIFLVQILFWYKSVRVHVRPQTHDLRSMNAFGHFTFAFPHTYA